MSKRALCAAAIGCALALAGCNTTAITADVTKLDPSAPATIGKVQSAAIKACGFEPAASTVVGILGKVTGYSIFTDPATDVAARICAAVTKTASLEPMAAYAALKRPKAKSKPAPTVDGVPVKGRFVAPPAK